MKKMQEVMHEVYGSDDEYIKELLREGGFNALWNIEFEEVKDN
jgi:phosphorylcholine metabolism protein LicD